MTSTSRLRLALRELADLAGRSGADQPSCTSWESVEAFVRACLTHAEAAGRLVPSPLDDLEHYRDLYEPADVHNVASGTVNQVFQARDVHGDVHLHRAPAARSAYLEQVRRIAPDHLYDRDEELAELAAWCLDEEHDTAYTWWQAPAWAGKSALMSWFVLYPPPGVRVVSFFVTARLSSQNHKTAFAEVVLEQLAELVNQPLPELLTDATRDAHLLGLLNQAAASTRQRGERLVLVVDGLDEDRGVTVGPEAHSIAALLPARPAAGLRVVVAGRPHPPIPADVPERHPLRDHRIVRSLGRSSHADVVRADAQRELNHLLRGTPAERDLLGLVTAAGGGLTSNDLAGLTGWPEWEVEEHLHAVSGRTFSRRRASWGSDTNPPVYLLAHEQLQQDAIRMLGAAQVAAYRDRLHFWAGQYRDQGWPLRTPEYLLRGYFRLLHETADTERMVSCALDRQRHLRMLDLTGGNGAALTEIAAAQEALDAQPVQDLLAMVRLTIYRAELQERNFFIPQGLPESWARLGQHARAEALAWSLPDPDQQTRALIAVARAVAASGDLSGALRIARTIDPAATDEVFAPDPPTPSAPITPKARPKRVRSVFASRKRRAGEVLAEDVTKAVAEGRLVEAEALARRLPRGQKRWRALGQVVKAVVRTGDLANAERIARTIHREHSRAQALTDLVIATAETGDSARAEALATEAEQLARIVTPLPHQPEVLIALLRAVAKAGDPEQARHLADTVTDLRQRGEALTELVALLAEAGEAGKAEEVMNAIAEPLSRARALVVLHRAAAGAGDAGTAARMIAALPAAVGAVRSSRDQAAVWARLPAGLALSGDRAGAESLARSIGHALWREHALAGLAVTLASAGHLDQAVCVAAAITQEGPRALALAIAGAAAVRGGDAERAEMIIEPVTDPRWRVRALTELAAAAGGAQAQRFAEEAHACCDAVTFTEQKAVAMAETALAFAGSGDWNRAELVRSRILISRRRDEALAGLAATADLVRARSVVDRIDDTDTRARALASLAARSPESQARQLIAAVLRLRKWTPVLDVLVTIEPATVVAIGEDFLSPPRPRPPSGPRSE